MDPAKPVRAGYLGLIRSLGDSIVAGVQDRISLFAIELQEEKIRLAQIAAWVSAAVFAAVMASTFASLLLVYLFWDRARLIILGGLSAFFGAVLVVIIVAFRSYLRRQPRPFAGTVQELGKDRSCIRNGI